MLWRHNLEESKRFESHRLSAQTPSGCTWGMQREFWAIVFVKISPELWIAWDGIRADVNLKLRGKRPTKCSKQNWVEHGEWDSLSLFQKPWVCALVVSDVVVVKDKIIQASRIVNLKMSSINIQSFIIPKKGFEILGDDQTWLSLQLTRMLTGSGGGSVVSSSACQMWNENEWA